MEEPTPATEDLKRQQRAQEVAEREALTKAEHEAEAKKHERRADKARYLREKLEQQTEADRTPED
jgi:hypothetical protein